MHKGSRTSHLTCGWELQSSKTVLQVFLSLPLSHFPLISLSLPIKYAHTLSDPKRTRRSIKFSSKVFIRSPVSLTCLYQGKSACIKCKAWTRKGSISTFRKRSSYTAHMVAQWITRQKKDQVVNAVRFINYKYLSVSLLNQLKAMFTSL